MLKMYLMYLVFNGEGFYWYCLLCNLFLFKFLFKKIVLYYYLWDYCSEDVFSLFFGVVINIESW